MLRNVGLECFMLVFQGEDIGSVFSTEDDHDQPWVATLHNDHCRPTSVLPNPFKAASHRFTSFSDLQAWLGISASADALEVAA
jgi:hypothetical protein